MQRTKYLLTINGHPAIFIGGQICYARNKYRGAGIRESELCSSTREAKRLIAKTIEWRKAQGFDKNGTSDYGYVPIKLGV